MTLLRALVLLLLPALATAQDQGGVGRSLLEGFSRLSEGFGAPAAREFLPLEQAFPVSAQARGEDAVAVVFDIAEGYYLYRDKFGFQAAEGSGLTLGPAQVPAGEWKDDAEFGRVEVNKHRTEILLPLAARAPAPGPVSLTVRYQGCAEDGICYPPATAVLEVGLPPAGVPAATAAPPALPAGLPAAAALPADGPSTPLSAPAQAAGGPPTGLSPPAPPAAGPSASAAPVSGPAQVVSEQEQVTRLLSAGVDVPTLLKFFGIGLLLAFTPCVFPMVPILSGIVVGRGADASTLQALGLSSVYVLAMALTYAGVGVLAGLFGQNLQAHAQNPYVLVPFAVLFVLLALSMFGLYTLQLPTALQSRLSAFSARQRRGSLLGAAVMGLISAVVVGPCVAAPLAGTLAYIGLTGDGVFGGAALFAMALGMGTPLLLVGTSAGRLLPHAGPWMAAVQRVLGVLLLAVAIYLLSRLLPGPAVLLLWALLLVVSAVYMGAFDPIDDLATGWQRLWKGLSLALLTYGVTLIVGAAGGASDPLQPLGGWRMASGQAAETRLPFAPVKTPEELQARLSEAAGRGQPVMLDFYADWCVECKRMERTTFADEEVRRRLEPVLLLKADVTAYDQVDRALLGSLGLHGPPATLFFTPAGIERRELRLAGYVAPQAFLAHLSRALPQ